MADGAPMGGPPPKGTAHTGGRAERMVKER
jgi:hypothetical protein